MINGYMPDVQEKFRKATIFNGDFTPNNLLKVVAPYECIDHYKLPSQCLYTDGLQENQVLVAK